MKKYVNLILILLLSSSLYAFKLERPTIMPVEEAFQTTFNTTKDTLDIHLSIGEKIYVYKNKLSLKSNDGKVLSLTLPKAVMHDGEEVYFHTLDASVPLSQIDAKELTLEFQGCSEIGICYPPVKEKYTVDTSSKPLAKTTTPTDTTPAKVSEENQIANLLQNSNIFLILATFFGFGLLLALTPCVFPMIPILSSLIAAQSGEMSAKRGFMLSLIYILSMSVTYTFAGVLAGMFGANLQAALQNPWVIGAFSGVFVLLAFSMFDYFAIELPQSLQNYFNKKSNDAQGNGIMSIAVMGFLSALIVGPCIAPPLAGALVYIGQTGDAVLGGLALFTLSMGMGTPLLLIGTAAGKYMPKPGGWMNRVSQVFGVVMLGVAIWMLSRIVEDSTTMFLWALLAIGTGIFFGALEPMEKANDKNFIKKFITFLLFFYGLILFIGALSGATNPLKPLSHIGGSASTSIPKAQFESVNSLENLQDKINHSSSLVMVDFTAKWCVSCKELEENTFSDARVINAFSNMQLLQANVTENSEEDKRMQKAYGIVGPPAILFFRDGKEIQGSRIIGYKPADEFLTHINSL